MNYEPGGGKQALQSVTVVAVPVDPVGNAESAERYPQVHQAQSAEYPINHLKLLSFPINVHPDGGEDGRETEITDGYNWLTTTFSGWGQ
jgi:hypothetical protein